MKRLRKRILQDVTIRDVAARAQVAPITVSRVMNGSTSVAEPTRKAVMVAVRELNYAPNTAARRLSSGTVFSIALLYGESTSGFLAEFLLAALRESRRGGHDLQVERFSPTPAAQNALLERLVHTGVEGVILPPHFEAPGFLTDVRNAGLAAVSIGSAPAGPDVCSVRMDNYQAARDMTVYLLSLGHRHIGFIKGHPDRAVSAQRQQGFLDALSDAGLSPPAECLEQGYFNYRSGLAAAELLLSRTPRPTAIFAANDNMAAATLDIAHRLGLDVPRELSIAGFDDSLIATTLWPPLTTVHQPIAAMARASVELLLWDIRRRRSGTEEPPPQPLLRHRLILRGSTGTACAAHASAAHGTFLSSF